MRQIVASRRTAASVECGVAMASGRHDLPAVVRLLPRPATVLAESLFTGKYGVERGPTRNVLQPPDESARLCGAVFAIHAAILPFHRQRAVVIHAFEGSHDGFEIDPAAPQRAEVPVSIRMAKGEVAAEDAREARSVAPPYILHVNV